MTARGLTAAEAAARLGRDGRNELPPPPPRSGLRRLADQLFHFFAAMLWVAGGLAFLAGLPQLGIAIFIVILLNAIFAFAQESRATHAAERLRALLPRRVTVRRNGALTMIDAAEVVADDLLVLGAGDHIPADAMVQSASSAQIDASTLTGESLPVTVGAGDTIFAGTFLVEGELEAVVAATGARTRLAGIARMTTATPAPPTPLTLELHRVVRTIAVIAAGVGILFFVLALLLGTPASDGFVFGIGVTVALVPEGLLPTVTLSLAWGAERMAKQQVLVRKLDAVQTLGSTTFICTDKTGTLTQNRMAVVAVWTPAGRARVTGEGYEPTGEIALDDGADRAALERAVWAGARASSGHAVASDAGWVALGDPMEAAIDVAARRFGVAIDDDRRRNAEIVRFPFDPRRRRMSVVLRGEGGYDILVKGAPDAVLPLCAAQPAGQAVVEQLTREGLRTLAVASVRVTSVPTNVDEGEHDLTLLAILGLEDPQREDVAGAIAQCRSAGIRVAMITGDHPATATAIATKVGLRTGDEPVLVGGELPADDQVLGALVDRDGVVVARVAPEDKLRIARALRERGHVVAMTGDGVNDGPALHEANIGIAMGRSGTDVAREAADLVLLDDHFASIVAAVQQGRATFINLRRFLTYHLTDNVAELTPFVVWALSGGRFPLALGVLQILAIDIGTDTLSAVALGAEPPSQNVLAGPPVKGRLLNHTVARRAFALLGPTVALATMAAFVVSMVGSGWSPGESFPTGDALAAASGAAFMAVVLGQKANVFACRSSTRRPGELGWFTNRLLLPAATIELAFALAVLWISPIASELEHRNPTLVGWAMAAAAAPAMLIADAVDKRRRRQTNAIR